MAGCKGYIETVTGLIEKQLSSLSDARKTFYQSLFLTAVSASAAHAGAAPEMVDEGSAPVTIEVVGQQSTNYKQPLSVAGKEPLAPREIPHSVSVITQQRINDQNLKTVPDALNQVTGVTVIANDSTQSQMRSRGYSLGVMYDGIPAYSSLSGVQQFDLDIYDRVEVLRGPSGIFTGTDSPGGVVNLVRKRAKDEFALTGSVSAGSWDNYHVALDVTDALNESGSVRGRAVMSFTDRDYFYEKTHTERWLGYSTLEWDLNSDTTLSLSAAIQKDDTPATSYGLPAWSDGHLMDVSRSTNPIADWAESRWDTQEYTAELEHQWNNGWLMKARVSQRLQDFYFKDGYVSSSVDINSQTTSYGRMERDYEYKRTAVDLYATGPLQLFGRSHTLLAGYNAESYNSAYEGVNATTVTGIPFGQTERVPDFNLPYDLGGETDTTQSGFYSQARLSLADPLTLVLGGRLSDYTGKSRSVAPAAPSAWSDDSHVSDQFTPYGALLYDFSKSTSAYISRSDIFIPQSRETYAGGMLDPREGSQTEVGLKSEFFAGQLQASIAWFRLQDSNRAYQDPNHVGYYLNAGEVESKGWEIEVSGQPSPDYEIQAGYTLLETKYLADSWSQGEVFSTWEPRHTLKLWGMRHFRTGALQHLSLGLGVNTVSGSSAGTGSWAIRSQDGYSIVNAMARYPLNRHVTLSLNLNNLTDQTYYTRLGGWNTYNTYGEPRSLSLKLQASY
ncbi:TonB-dependent siderophore receptor [Amphritea sp.]|uniref:TonB-dependent siderophore receptor n=1 Tax=Amphritea sp. TaxID=1872502 RepID=UPI003D0CA97C